jgi:hypothetical protein
MATPTKPRLPQQSSAQYPLAGPNAPSSMSVPNSTNKTQRSIRPATIGRLWQQARTTLKGQFILLATCIFLLSLLAALFVTQAFRQSYSDLDTIASGSVPSVDAAQAMSQYIEDIDAKSADYLAAASLTEKNQCTVIGSNRNAGNLTDHDCDQVNIDAELILANQQLYLAIHNVTYPGERTAVQRITAGFEEYSADIAIEQHEYALATSKTNPGDEHLQRAEQAYLAATNVLNVRITRQPTLDANGNPVYDESAIPNCTIAGRSIAAKQWPLGSLQQNIDCLSGINKGYLDSAYNDTMNFLGLSTLGTGILCLVFCMLLIFTSTRMVMVTHRILNTGLVLATIVALIFSFTIVSSLLSMSGRHGTFGSMVKDDYDSIYYAALLKRYGTAANADESRWLIAVDFGDKVEMDRWQQDWYTNKAQVETLIKRAVANRTYPEEDQPLTDMQLYWGAYTRIDPQIRALASTTTNPNRIHDAQQLSTGKSNENFYKFTTAVDQLSTANRNYYNSTYRTTDDNLTRFIPLSIFLFPVIGLLALWGTSRRLKDF